MLVEEEGIVHGHNMEVLFVPLVEQDVEHGPFLSHKVGFPPHLVTAEGAILDDEDLEALDVMVRILGDKPLVLIFINDLIVRPSSHLSLETRLATRLIRTMGLVRKCLLIFVCLVRQLQGTLPRLQPNLRRGVGQGKL